jgi:hypothetical protein
VNKAAEAFGLPAPKVYVGKPGRAIAAASTKPPSLVAVQEVLEGAPEGLLTFYAAKNVFALTTPLLARAVFPTVSELTAVVTMAVHATVDAASELRARMRPGDLAELAARIGEARAASGEIDVKRWSQLVDLSSSRAALLLAGDMKTARTALASEGQSPGDLPLKDQLRELSLFFLGDTNAALRRTLGLAVPL